MRFANDNGIIDLSHLQKQIEMSKRKELIDQHPFDIWQAKNGKWYTYLPDDVKGRVQRKRNTKEEIEKLIVDYYKDKEENPTVKELFYEWLNRRLDNNEIEKATYSRYETDFVRCFGKFGERKIKSIDELDIEDFLKSAIRDKKMSQKAFSNIKTLMYGTFKYAKKKKLVKYSIREVIGDIEFSKKEFTKIEHSDEEQVFFVKEEERLMAYLENNMDEVNLGLMLIFKTGLRIGELCTLKHSDIHENSIEINRTETRYKDRDTGEIVFAVKENPKTDAGKRKVVVKNEYVWLLKKIKRLYPFGEYVFMRDGEWMKSHVFRNRLYYLCEKLDIIQKSPHNIRKTYGSKLYDSNIPKSVMCNQMGHTDVACLERYYYYNRYDDNEIAESINNIVNL